MENVYEMISLGEYNPRSDEGIYSYQSIHNCLKKKQKEEEQKEERNKTKEIHSKEFSE